jgi:hypothetical protein
MELDQWTPVEQMSREAAHGCVEIRVGDGAVGGNYRGLIRLQFDVAAQTIVKCHARTLGNGDWQLCRFKG